MKTHISLKYLYNALITNRRQVSEQILKNVDTEPTRDFLLIIDTVTQKNPTNNRIAICKAPTKTRIDFFFFLVKIH